MRLKLPRAGRSILAIVSLVAGALGSFPGLAVAPTLNPDYGLVYGGSPQHGVTLYGIDPSSGAEVSAGSLTQVGGPSFGAATHIHGATVDPTTNTTYLLLRMNPGANQMILARVNLVTREFTTIGNTGQRLSSLAADAHGTLYGIFGDSNGSLFTIDKTTAAATYVATLNSTFGGHALAYNPADDSLYHWYGCSTGMERVALGSYARTTIPTSGDYLCYAMGAVFDPSSGNFYVTDIYRNGFEVSTAGVIDNIHFTGRYLRGLARHSPTLFGVSPEVGNLLVRFDPVTGTENVQGALVQVAGPNFGSINKATAIARDPTTGTVYVALNMSGTGTWVLGTLDLQTRNVTTIADTGRVISSLAFDDSGTLYALMGEQDSCADCLYTINKVSGAATYRQVLSGDAGHAIAYNSEDGFLYHWSGSPSVMRKVDTGTFAVTAVPMSGDSISWALGAFFDPSTGGFVITDYSSRGVYVVSKDGASSRISNLPSYRLRGLVSGVSVGSTARDFGDAPAPYPTLLSANGARHALGGPCLGTCPDSEADGQPNSTATGDDFSGSDDEDGITVSEPFQGAEYITLYVQVTNGPAVLDAWVDLNQDGDWTDPGEKFLDFYPVSSGSNEITVKIPAFEASGQTFARFRISSAGISGPTGAAPDGEVEDYVVNLDGKGGFDEASYIFDDDGEVVTKTTAGALSLYMVLLLALGGLARHLRAASPAVGAVVLGLCAMGQPSTGVAAGAAFDGYGRVYAIERQTDDLVAFDPRTGAVYSDVSMTVVGGPSFGSLQIGSSVAMDPSSNTAYVLLEMSAASGGVLGRVNLATAEVTTIGDTGVSSISSIAIDGGGAIYAVVGGASGCSACLYSINKDTGAATYLMTLSGAGGPGSFSGGHVITYNPADGHLYHWYGSNTQLERVDLASMEVDNVGVEVSISWILGAYYDPLDDAFIVGNINQRTYRVTSSGNVSGLATTGSRYLRGYAQQEPLLVGSSYLQSPARLVKYNPRTGAVLGILELEGTSQWGVLQEVQGIAMDPDSFVVYAALIYSGSPQDYVLGRVNLVDGTVDLVGNMGLRIPSMVVARGKLYALTGPGESACRSCLYEINRSTAAPTFVADLTGGSGPGYTSGGHAIAYNSADGLLYHWAGFAPQMETLDLDTLTLTTVAVGGGPSYVTGAFYDPSTGGFIVSDLSLRFYSVSSAGSYTLLSYHNQIHYPHGFFLALPLPPAVAEQGFSYLDYFADPDPVIKTKTSALAPLMLGIFGLGVLLRRRRRRR